MNIINIINRNVLPNKFVVHKLSLKDCCSGNLNAAQGQSSPRCDYIENVIVFD